MGAPPDASAFLADDESVIVAGVPGTLINGTRRSTGAIGVTDRRVLFRSDDGRFVEVAHEAITSLQSRPSIRFTRRGRRCRVLIGVGGLVAGLSLLGVIALDSSVLAVALVGLAVGGAVGSEYVRRHGVPLPAADRTHRQSSRPMWAPASLRRLAWLTEDRHGSIALGLALLAFLSMIGLVAVIGSLLAVVPTLGTLFGIAVVDHANRRRRILDAIGESRRRQQLISIHLADGRSLHVRVSDADRMDRELSGIVRTGRPVGATRLVEP